MNRREAKRIVLSQLAGYLRREVIIDGVHEEQDLAVFEAAQRELIAEFLRRSAGEQIPERFNSLSRGR